MDYTVADVTLELATELSQENFLRRPCVQNNKLSYSCVT